MIYFFPSKLHALLSVTQYIFDIFARIFNGLPLLCTTVLNITSQGWCGGTLCPWEETGRKKRAGGKGRKKKGGRKRAGGKGRVGKSPMAELLEDVCVMLGWEMQ
jgi:hypothetical protein